VLQSIELTVFVASLHQDHDLQDALGTDAKADGAEHVINMKGVGTFRVADGHDSADEQRRLLAKRSLAEVQRGPRSLKMPGSRLDTMPHTQVVAPLAAHCLRAGEGRASEHADDLCHGRAGRGPGMLPAVAALWREPRGRPGALHTLAIG